MANQQNIAISGGSKGIGRAIAQLFGEKDWRVFVAARTESDLNEMKTLWAKAYPKSELVTCVCDLGTVSGCAEFITAIKSKTNQLQVLVNNLGVFEAGNLLGSGSEKLSDLLTTNVLSANRLSLGLLSIIEKAARKHIINIGSVATVDWPNGMNCYSISKFAFQGWHQAIRQELSEKNIPVSIIHPGATLTHSWDGVPTEGMDLLDAKDIAKTVAEIWANNETQDIDAITIRPKKKN